MKLFHRILLAPLVTIVLMLFLGGVSYWTMSSQRQAMQSLVDGRFVNATMAEEMRSGILTVHASAYRILTWGDINGAKFTDQETKKMLSNFDAVSSKFSNWASSATKEDGDLAKQMVGSIDKYKKSVVAALDMASADRNAGVVAMQSADDNFKAVNELTERLMGLERDIGNRDVERANAFLDKTLIFSIGTLLVAIVLSAGIAVTASRSVFRQLGGEPAFATELVTKIATGDLSTDIPLKAGDTTSLLSAMKRMVEKLTEIVGQIKDGTESINTAAKEIASGNTDLSSRTEKQASGLEETASSMEELSSTVKQNAENAKQANQLAIGASSVAVKGGEEVSQVVGTMRAINESSKKIVDIISVIDGIAFQTNILALNAAVEAARAGEQGRGFAVVATEVRNLAQRSAAAAKEIKALIGDSVDKVGAGTKLVDEAGKTMQEIVASVKRVTDIMSEITAASQEQNAGIEQVNQAITQMDEVTQQNAALVEEATAAAESLEEQAHNLMQAVAVFNIGKGSGARPVSHSVEVAKHEAAGAVMERRGPNRASNIARLPAKSAKTQTAVSRAKAVASGSGSGKDEWEES